MCSIVFVLFCFNIKIHLEQKNPSVFSSSSFEQPEEHLLINEN